MQTASESVKAFHRNSEKPIQRPKKQRKRNDSDID